jgi:hypothetical protein
MKCKIYDRRQKRGERAIWESTGTYFSLVLLGREWLEGASYLEWRGKIK